MSIKAQAIELTVIAQNIIEEKGLNIKELLDNNEVEILNEIWAQAVRTFDKKIKESLNLGF